MTETPEETGNGLALPVAQKVLLKPEEAAAMLSISERTLWKLTDDGRIPCLRIGALKRYRRAALEAWAEAEEADPWEPPKAAQRSNDV